MVYGSRFLGKEVRGGSRMSNLANGFLTRLANFVFRTKITDVETCYKLVPAKSFKALKLVEQRFGFEPEITAKLAKDRSLKWAEVPITYRARTEEQGKNWVERWISCHLVHSQIWIRKRTLIVNRLS